MTIDQLNEINEWLSPLDKYPTIGHVLVGLGKDCDGEYIAEVYVNMPSRIIALYFRVFANQIEIEYASEIYIPISSTSIWEQICLRVL